MITSEQVVGALKQALRQRKISYLALAGSLGLSESAVKKMFASANMSLKRVDEICAELNLDFADLVELVQNSEPRVEQLDYQSEKMLVSDIRLLLVTYCLFNYWHIDDIIQRYQVSNTEAIRYLAQLDRMKLIELLPENRVRLLISASFQWIENGPIERFFRSQVQSEFFADQFSDVDCARIVCNADLSNNTRMQLIERMKMLQRLFDDFSQQDRPLSSAEKQGTTMVLAIRPWQFTAFTALERV